MNAPSHHEVSWRALLNRQYLPKLAIMALALWLHASNSMLTATTMPSAVDEIGGLNLISWTFALYLAGSICAAASISLLVANFGLRATMIRTSLVFSVGCVVVATAPSMGVLLAGRVLQGLGGGGLIALVYVSQDRFFPNHLVPKSVAFLSTVWTMASFSGPLVGGAFATAGEWRLAYWVFGAQGLLLIPLVRWLLRSEPASAGQIRGDESIPLVRLALLASAILVVSVSGAWYHPLLSPLLILLGCLALLLVVWRDRRALRGRMLPVEIGDFGHAIGNGIPGVLLLCISIMSFLVYGPLILIELYGLTPLEAGLVILVETVSWGTAAVFLSGLRAELEPRLIRSGSMLVVIGLAVMALLFPRGALWPVILAVIAINAGFGMMWGFIIKRIVGAAAPADRDRTSSLLPITQQTGFALGAALSGLIANGFGILDAADDEGMRRIAFWLFAAFVPVAFLGMVMMWRFVSPRARSSAAQVSVAPGSTQQ